MTAADVLLVAGKDVQRGFLDHAPDARIRAVADPYDALGEMAKHNWPLVMLWGPGPDFEGLCRAARRLQPASKLVGLCRPDAEGQISAFKDWPLDDYLLYPLDGPELARMLPKPQPQPSNEMSLSVDDIATLIESARMLPSLELKLEQLVQQRLDEQAGWFDSAASVDPSTVLVTMESESGRKLCLSRPMLETEAAFARDLQIVASRLERAAQRSSALHRLAVTDDLTGAYNRRYFFHLTEQVLRRGDKHRVTLLLYDIDNFKQYNDAYGHAVGDEILRETAMLMRRTTRAHDIVARIGGDEFAVLFWDAQPRQAGSKPPESAVVLANRFRQAVSTHRFPSLGPAAVGTLTISGGLASYPKDGRTCADLLRKADEALVEAKRSGKNSIRIVGKGPIA